MLGNISSTVIARQALVRRGAHRHVLRLTRFAALPPKSQYSALLFQYRFNSTSPPSKTTDDRKKVSGSKPDNVATPIANPKPTAAKVPLMAKIKKVAAHYWDGTKLLGFEVKTSFRLLIKMLAGHSLTRREMLQLKRTTSDVIRLVPFAAFILVPFAELLLPVALKLFPNLLPSTYESKKDKESKLENLRKTREVVVGIMKERKSHFKPGNITDEQKRLFNDFYKHVKETGEPGSRKQLIEVARLYTDDTILDNLTRPYLVALAKYMNIQSFGTDVMLRYRIRYRMLELKKDDISIYYEDAEQLDSSELRSACASRGIRIKDTSDAALKENLRIWLQMRLKDKIPSTLLIMATSYNYGAVTSKKSLYDSLTDVLSALPDELYHEVKVNVVKEKDASPKQKLEQFKEQEEIMKEEEEQEESAKVRVKDQLSLDELDKQNERASEAAAKSAQKGKQQ
ncbi:Ylh47p KNAG_0A07700 [Huiozyma naganishii CBS 8797]|uniref:Letm1 RBD domain-containing protein n=1 Tax=Huiozyma naganishii (strain ATCC MYA-139 / BCRC 22969 / CBS 8797 / KCTC 17520 / NBRC 10181 / NCYC 3082 / Yp74L-3) TaxID=1071383 RepID=J7RFV6_HUIN7|nr:hypothetical protein KNAG_0A07700 [Kazachstania naganishii CBS 8797]CCK68423.1 hypothetical protein KNAG_0A07700 [Kazachstania naganishii CBS 8797]